MKYIIDSNVKSVLRIDITVELVFRDYYWSFKTGGISEEVHLIETIKRLGILEWSSKRGSPKTGFTVMH